MGLFRQNLYFQFQVLHSGLVCYQAPTLLAVDERGTPLRPALIWMDRRAGMEADEIAKQFGFAEIVNRTGNRPDPYFVAAKLRWRSKHEPEIAKEAHRFLHIRN